MLANTKLRTKLVAIAVPPMLVLAIVAVYGGFVTFLQDSMSADELQGDLRIISILAIVGIISSILAVFAMRDRIMAPILQVTEGARELAENRLPVLIEGLRDPNAQIPEFDLIDFNQSNELGDLAAALNTLQITAGEISAEQKNIFKRGISDLVVNLARRNQSLLDRQIESIDRLEADEEDPDRLEQLFSLDHLATRMRRNAESLLVLAGSEPARRRGGPVALADVLRVAMSEIEDYRKVQLSNMEHAEIGAQSAVDLAHLMSELIENATQFSPPDAPVEVKGGVDEAGSYVIGIIDHGIGMNDEQLGAANDLLRNPPDLGITLTRSLGFLVVGQLSKRLGVGIELVKTPGSGTTAIVVVPAALLAGAVRQSVQESSPSLPTAIATAPPPPPMAEAEPVVEAPAEWSQPTPALSFDSPILDVPPQWEQPPAPTAFDSPSLVPPAPEPPASSSWEQPAPPEQHHGTPEPMAWEPEQGFPAAPEPAPEFEAPVFEAPAPEPAPAYEAPAYEAPAYEEPPAAAYEAPAYEEPAAAAYEPPPYEAPAYEEPVAAAYEPPVYEAQVYEEPLATSYEPPVYGALAYEEPEAGAFEPPTYEAPASEEPEAAAFEPPVYEPPAPEAAPEVEAPFFEAPAPEPAQSPDAPIQGWDDPQPEFESAPEFEPAPAFEQPQSFEAPRPIPGWDDPEPSDVQAAQHQATQHQAAPASPIDWAAEPEPSSSPTADFIPGWDDPPPPSVQHSADTHSVDTHGADTRGADTRGAESHAHDELEVPSHEPVAHQAPESAATARQSDPFAAAFQRPIPGQMPPVSRLDQAIPSGEEFDAGVEELLQEPQERTPAGLARRDRDTSQAPVSESRPVAASVRSPDEVRNMLARYRSGLKGNPGNGDQS